MESSASSRPQRYRGLLWFAGAGSVVLLLMAISAMRDIGPTGLPGDLPNWHNRPSDYSRFALAVLFEGFVAVLLLRPWSYNRSWGRSACTFLLLLPWLSLNLLMMIHSGGIMVIHTLWLFALWTGCGVAAVWPGALSLLRTTRDDQARAVGNR